MDNQENNINNDSNVDDYTLLADSLVSLTDDGNKSITLLCLSLINIKDLADCLTQRTDKLISSITYDKEHCTGDISFGDNTIFINPAPQFYDPSSYMDLIMTITSQKGKRDTEAKELINLAYAKVLKKESNIAQYSHKEISHMISRQMLSIVTGVDQEKYMSSSFNNELNRKKEDSILNNGNTDYSLHPEGVSPWHNDLLE